MVSYVLLGHICAWATSRSDVIGDSVEIKLCEACPNKIRICTSDRRETLRCLYTRNDASSSPVGELHLAQLVSSNKCRADGCVVSCTAVEGLYVCKVRLDLNVRTQVLEGLHRWDPSRAAASVFSRLLPVTTETLARKTACPECSVEGAADVKCTCEVPRISHRDQVLSDDEEESDASNMTAAHDTTPDAQLASDAVSVGFKLHECFHELPNLVTTPVQYPPAPARLHPGTPSALEILPIEALYRIAELSLDISALACSCRLYRAICAEVCPDLLPTLHSHQRAAARCMMAREAPPKQLPHPYIRRLPLCGAGSGLYAYADCASGHLSIEQPPTVHDVRGGLFCDEPGLGKTVTALGIVLKTLGVEPTPPAATEVRSGIASDPDGLRPVHGRFYMARVDSLVAEARDEAGGGAADADAGDEEAAGARGRASRSERQSRKERAAMETPRLMLSPRNRTLLEDLDLIPRLSTQLGDDGGGATGGAGGGTGGGGRADVTGVVPGFVSEAEAFVGGARRNVDHFRAVFLRFCIAYNITPYALSEIPVLKHLLDRLRPRGAVKLPRASVRAAVLSLHEHDEVHEDAADTLAPAPVRRAARRLADEPQPQRAAAAVTICRPHASARVTVLRRECANWQKTIPSERPAKRPRKQTAAEAASAAAASAADQGVGRAEALLAALGFVEAAPAAVAPAAKRSKRGPADAEPPVPSPSKPRSNGATGGGPSPVYVLPDPLRSSPGHRLDVPALEEGLMATSDAYALVAAHEPVPLSAATLVVVPGILVDHWRHEIAKHVRPGALRVYYLETVKDADIPAHRLAWDYDVVMTTFSHLSGYGGAAHLRDRNLRHVVLQVHWLRVILDEGHALGRSTQTNRLALLSAIRAERRWVMTGTPAPHTAQSRVSPLLPLLGFLRCQPYHGSRGGLAFDAAIRNPFESGRIEGKERLMEVLQRIMIRSSKAGVTESLLLPKCTKSTVRLQFDPIHQASYNALVEVVMRNLLLADWFDEGHKESILHPSRSKWAAELLHNMRLACTVAGQTNIEPANEDVLEAIQILASSFGYPVPEGPATTADMVPESHPLSRVELALRHGGPCDACNAATRMPFVTPCAHMLCVDCTAKDSSACANCGTAYRQQPVDDPARKVYNRNPRAPVPIDLIELQPVFVQRGARGSSGGAWQPQWQATRSTKCDYLVRRLRDLGLVPPPPPPELPQWEEYVPPPDAPEATAAAGPAGEAGAGERTNGATNSGLAQAGGASAGSGAATADGSSEGRVAGGGDTGRACGGGAAADGNAQTLTDDGRCLAHVGHAPGDGEKIRGDAGAAGAGRHAELPDDPSESDSETSSDGPGSGPADAAVAASVTSAQRRAGSPPAAAGVSGGAAGATHGDDSRASATAAAALPRRSLCAAPQAPPATPSHAQHTAGGQEGAASRTRRVTFYGGEVSAIFEYPRSHGSSLEGETKVQVGSGGKGVAEQAGATAAAEGPLAGEASQRTPSPTKLRPPCMHRRSLAEGATLKPILRKQSSIPRPWEYVPGPHEQFAPPPLCPRPQRGRRRTRRALIDVETATNSRGAQHGAAAAADGGGVGHTVLGSADAAAAGTLGVLRAVDGQEKAIVYSAFWQHLLLVEKHLADANALFVVLRATMGRMERARAIAAFRHGSARIMLMDSIGSVGLDLSFVQHVFLMEPLGDLSLEQQIVSRAHRLGATRPVHAEVLVMQGSIEDDLVCVANGQRTQKLQEASSTEHSFISMCQAECWAKMEGQAEGMGRPMRNLLLTSLKRTKTQAA